MEQLDIVNTDRGTEAERGVLLVTYILHGLCFTVITAIIALTINYIKIRDTQSAFIRSHHRWLLRTFWWGLFWAVLCFASSFIGIGLIGFLALGIWWLYRVIYGVINFFENKPMSVPA